LERYSTLSKRHLVLSHINNPKYVNFYLRRKAEGDFLILDNGAYEGQFSSLSLLDKIRVYSPDVVVLPDHYLQDWKKTWHDASEFLDRYYHQFNNSWMYVPQSTPGDILGWVNGLTAAIQDPRIGWIGLPRALGTDIAPYNFVRANMCKTIKNFGKRVHALGMLSGSVEELHHLAAAGCNSIDSNAPVWRGFCNWRLDSAEKWPEIDVMYDLDVERIIPDLDESILHNLELCNVDVSARRSGGSTREESGGGEVSPLPIDFRR
jgi:hypothetical protein